MASSQRWIVVVRTSYSASIGFGFGKPRLVRDSSRTLRSSDGVGSCSAIVLRRARIFFSSAYRLPDRRVITTKQIHGTATSPAIVIAIMVRAFASVLDATAI